MQVGPRILGLCFILSTSSAQDLPEVTGLNALAEVSLEQLSQRDPNDLGGKALAINPSSWKHGETEHFIYHFVHSYVATPISVEAEFHYRVVRKELGQAEDEKIKSHIYIFEKPEDWQQFQGAGKLEPWTGGIHSQGSLFILRNPAYKYSGNSLGHEIVHLVLHRLYPDGTPCWLSEGLAQYISKNAHSAYQRARNYIAKPHSQAVEPDRFIPLSALLRLTRPPDDNVTTFYDQSERFVRFLVQHDKTSFLSLLEDLCRHRPFESAFLHRYGAHFSTVSAFERAFYDYATEGGGNSLQQANRE